MLTPLAERLLRALHWPASWPMEWPAGILAALWVLVAAWLASWLLVRVLVVWLRRLTQATATDVDDRILAVSERPARRLLVVVGIYFAVGNLPLGETGTRVVTGLLFTIGVFIGVRVVTRILLVLIGQYGRRVTDDESKVQFEKDYLPLLSKVLGVIVAIIGLTAVLHHFNQNVTSLIAALGVGGLAIGLAAKDTLGQMLSGFVILIDRPFRPGDRIKLSTGEIGDVVEVGTRSTRVKLFDQNMLIVPNSELVNARVVNFNFPTHATRAQLDIGLAYGCDVEQAKQIILDVIRAQPEVTDNPPPWVGLMSFGDWALNLMASYTVAEYANAGAVMDRVRVLVYKRFNEAGLKIPFPTREIIQRNEPPPVRTAAK